MGLFFMPSQANIAYSYKRVTIAGFLKNAVEGKVINN